MPQSSSSQRDLCLALAPCLAGPPPTPNPQTSNPLIQPHRTPHPHAGCSAILDNMFYCLCDEGDGVLIPAPYYPAFDNDLQARQGAGAEGGLPGCGGGGRLCAFGRWPRAAQSGALCLLRQCLQEHQERSWYSRVARVEAAQQHAEKAAQNCSRCLSCLPPSNRLSALPPAPAGQVLRAPAAFLPN